MTVRGETEKIGLHCILATVYFLLLPLTIATSAGNSFLKLLTIPIGGYFVFTLIFNKNELQINLVHLLLAFYTICCLPTLFVSSTEAALQRLTGYFLNLVIYVSMSLFCYNDKELKFMENAQVVLLLIFTIIPLIGRTDTTSRNTLVLFGQGTDPNQFVGFFVFPLAVTLEKIYESKYRIFYLMLAALSGYTILLTGSRGGLLAILMTIAAFVVIYPETLKRKTLITISFLFAIVVFWVLIRPFLPERILARMSIEAVMETRGTYRGDIWIAMLDEIMESDMELFVGRGLDAVKPVFIRGKESLVTAHNHFIYLLYNQGLLGLFSFLTLMLACIGRCFKKRKCVAIAMFGMLALSFSLTFSASTKSLWNLIPYAAFVFPKAQTMKTKEEEPEERISEAPLSE